jgi:hypothetical protein
MQVPIQEVIEWCKDNLTDLCSMIGKEKPNTCEMAILKYHYGLNSALITELMSEDDPSKAQSLLSEIERSQEAAQEWRRLRPSPPKVTPVTEFDPHANTAQMIADFQTGP